MLEPLLSIISTKRIILASGSPRRHDILSSIGLRFEVMPSSFKEDLDATKYSPADYAKETAKVKAQDISTLVAKDEKKFDLIIGADTVIKFKERIIGKPKDDDDAFNTLKRLSGEVHQVCTGVALLYRNNMSGDVEVETFHEETMVSMAQVPDVVIRAYVETGEPRDKAGAYGIQGIGGTLISGIQGDYYNVVGFPLHTFCKCLYEKWKS